MTDLTIIIPTYNRADILRETLDSLSRLDTPDISYEVIVVDNNSSDHTKEVVYSFFDKLPIRYCFEKKQGKSNALNYGMSLSTGSIFVFVDDDVAFEKKWLTSLINASTSNPDINVFGGKILTRWPEGAPGWVFYSSSNFPYLFSDLDLGNNECRFSTRLPGGANFWVRKSFLKQNDIFFNCDYGPKGIGRKISGCETELLKRIQSINNNILYIPTAVVYHRVQLNELVINKLFKRFKAEGYSNGLYLKENENCRKFIGFPLYLLRENFQEFLKLIYFTIVFSNSRRVNSLFRLADFLGRLQSHKFDFNFKLRLFKRVD